MNTIKVKGHECNMKQRFVILAIITIVIALILFFSTGWFMFSAIFPMLLFMLTIVYLEKKQQKFSNGKFNKDSDN